ncbi:hypothetical protein A3D00_02415 [Candidatus Woesebacteria bacterium RIFCSPHIGHO2_02_FULL_38_9]|uniref:Uncharacterized protein n=1 Tax=Candidatus Woesebacteria bacterium RIFCSPHIGHO2_01_FULL_39_28 TaxID=1802496 RepID=A0A1F7YCQ9_9BACT|nr:MAG: hypothetical protein A2627_02675 [Candidatus Woesebacteria bacterium RIFCSPHIGHO2_01_FULL_39_28]OGM31577.1 MAG: hypothetical protein A3D00_02415 [Candidatus Woesebacteria bacterium RIFCSPHIGHO2_02_FULL_38_9]OGM58407.1 MAG: hypothetical protein A3A50_02600 [Candidatus Woesebacteria bacterium RIFCSPLOWO2_01_FULL_38_20]
MAKRRIQVTLREAAELPDIVFGQPTQDELIAAHEAEWRIKDAERQVAFKNLLGTTARRIVGGPTDAETRVVTIRKESEPSET